MYGWPAFQSRRLTQAKQARAGSIGNRRDVHGSPRAGRGLAFRLGTCNDGPARSGQELRAMTVGSVGLWIAKTALLASTLTCLQCTSAPASSDLGTADL